MFEFETPSGLHDFVVDRHARGEGDVQFETKFSYVAHPQNAAGVAVYFYQLRHAIRDLLVRYGIFRYGLDQFSTKYRD